MQKAYRLTDRADYSRIYRIGKSAANQQFIVYYINNNQHTHFRLGISASKKVGNAVVRNRLKRMIKEIVRLQSHMIPFLGDIVVIVRKPAIDLTYKEMEKCLIHALKKANLWKK